MVSLALSLLIALNPNDPWPLERQDRYGTAMATSGLALGEYVAPWRSYDLGENRISSHGPSIREDGVGFCGRWEDTTMRRFDTETGAITGTFAAANFVACTPAIDGARVIVSTDNPAGKVFGVDATTLFADWVQFTGYVASSPNVGPEGDVVYATSSGLITRRDGATGAEVWSRTGYTNPRGPVAFTRDDQNVILAHGSTVSAFRWSDGAPQWNHTVSGQAGTASVGPDGTIVLGDANGFVTALTPAGGFRWQRIVAGQVEAAPAFGPTGQVFIGSYDRSLYSFRLSDGNPNWSYYSSFAINRSVVAGHDGRVYFHNQGGDLYCLSNLGTLLWQQKVGDQARGPMTMGADGSLYVPYANNGVGGGMLKIRQDAPLLFFDPTWFSAGISGVGDPANMRYPDGATYRIESSASPPYASNMAIEFETTSPKRFLNSLTITGKIEGSMGPLILTAEIYNFTTNNWEPGTKRGLSAGVPIVFSLGLGAGASNAVQGGTNRIRCRLSLYRYSRATSQWWILIDQLSARVAPTY